MSGAGAESFQNFEFYFRFQGVLDLGAMKNVLVAPVSPPVDLARGRETQIGPILTQLGHFGTFGLSGALLLDPENQRNGESYLLICDS